MTKPQSPQSARIVFLEEVMRLARATGCPNDVPPGEWLLDQGLLVVTDDGYFFTEKAKGLRLV
jgi:hypothetical protein